MISQNYFLFFQRWVHKAKRLLEREGLDNGSLNNTKVTSQKLNTEIIDSVNDTSDYNK